MYSLGSILSDFFPTISIAKGREATTRKNIVDVSRKSVAAVAERKSFLESSFAGKWKNLSGEKAWEGLIDPLDSELRRYILHYEEMAQPTYDSNKWWKHAGDNLFSENDPFLVGFEKSSPYKYTITKFLYAFSSADLPHRLLTNSPSRETWGEKSNWVGYVAVVNDDAKEIMGRRDIVIAWRDTLQSMKWNDDLNSELVSASDILGRVDLQDTMIQHGFMSIYTSTDARSPFNKTSARDQIVGEVKRLVELYKDEETSITVTGHSIGAAMAAITAADIAVNGVNKSESMPPKACPVTAIIFAGPKVGDETFRRTCSKYDELRVLNVRNQEDIAPDCS